MSGIWLTNQKDLIWSKHQIGGSLNLGAVRELTEKCIKKRGWSILRPLIEQTVLSMFVMEFETQAKQQLPYWIRFSSAREVVRSLDQIQNLFPSVIESELYSDKVMFGSTPFLDALDRASSRLLDKAYKNRGKVLIVISDGNFREKHSSVLSAELLKHREVKIISCLLSEQDIVSRLVHRAEDTWPIGAQLMFKIASEITEEQSLDLKLSDDSLRAQRGKRLFFQINHSQILDDVIGAVFEKPV
ncbi:MAG: VWA domain-containing protein [Chloroflexi bacterium]|nr:VWA domain-containing protein [Chloroflexota bacterium]